MFLGYVLSQIICHYCDIIIVIVIIIIIIIIIIITRYHLYVGYLQLYTSNKYWF